MDKIGGNASRLPATTLKSRIMPKTNEKAETFTWFGPSDACFLLQEITSGNLGSGKLIEDNKYFTRVLSQVLATGHQ